MDSPRLEMRGIVKTFGPVTALNSVDLVVGRNEVHGLLGGNGAGKTTLMNVLYGLYRPNSGEVLLDGQPVSIGSPKDAIAAGVGMVHQTFLQVDNYTVTENIVLGTDVPGPLRLDLSQARERIRDLSERFGLAVDPDAVVEELPVGVRQRVEILKALYRGAKVLILDEPTTNLTPQEVDDLFGSMRAMVDDGMSVVLITHKIRETLSVCDRMTVMRDGRRVETIERSDTDAEHLAEKMVGSTTDPGAAVEAAALGAVDAEAVAETLSSVGTATAVAVRDLVVVNDQGHELIQGFDLELREGEIVGIAGVAGNGQVELAEALAGVRPLRGGSVEVGGRSMGGLATSAWLDHGVAYVPEDRHRDGILPTASITENLVLGSQRSPKVRRFGLIDWGAAKQRAVDAIAEFSVRANGPGTPAGDLSGGNIQRVILARAFAHRPRMLILHNPTRGLDIGSTRFVYQQVRAATAAGCAVLLISEDLDEVIALSDRVIALYQGAQAGEWPHGSVDAYEVGRSMTGLGEARV
jgi:simple sugar transport system ATP-binding protein